MLNINNIRHTISGRYWVFMLLLPVVLGLYLVACARDENGDTAERRHAFQIALRWNECLLELDRFSEGYSPPMSARMFAYSGLAVWESALPGLPEAIPCAVQFPELQLPSWDAGEIFVLPAAIDAAYATMARHFFPHTTLMMKETCARLSAAIHEELLTLYPPNAVLASRQYGEAVADAIYRWSATDSAGHQAFLFNFDRSYQAPEGAGRWRPSASEPMPPLLPYWGTVRTFTAHIDKADSRQPIEFSEAPNSAFFAQAVEVYSISMPLKEENRWIAEFWSDDFHGVTFSASARWISISNQALEKAQPGLATALETWLKVGMALNDAAVNVWRFKYGFNLERPETYIRRNINSNWTPLHHTPSFPGYPSGHACFAGAAAVVLTQTLGENFALTDRSHQGRKEFNGKPRSFESFAEMAAENALSRLLIGVHFRMDCEEGLRVGNLIGSKVAAMQLQRENLFARQE
ncbi:MAG: vanadium-dependent haloperoxidase [Saprospiraceae bacterium]|nr:vanadium-dependent haloperoxidase [Saprospiraceae bacterium]